MKTGSIYKITINNKIYIGQSIRPERRLQEHIWAAKQNNKGYLYNVIRKYGIKSIIFEIIESKIIIASNIEEKDNYLNIREKYWIKHYNSLKKGYNMTEGGGYGFCPIPWNKGKKLGPLSESHKKKVSNSKIGIKKSNKTKKKMSEAQLKKYENNPDIKKKISSSVSDSWSSLNDDEKQKRIENSNNKQKEYYNNREPFIFKLKQKDKTIFEYKGQKGEFRDICKEMKLPYDKLKDGKVMYENLDKGNMKKLTNIGVYPKYKGVYLEIN